MPRNRVKIPNESRMRMRLILRRGIDCKIGLLESYHCYIDVYRIRSQLLCEWNKVLIYF